MRRNENWNNIYMYDLSTKKETQYDHESSDSQDPVIYGNSIVWQVLAMEISTPMTLQLINI